MPQADPPAALPVSIELIQAAAQAIESNAALKDAVVGSIRNQLSHLQRELALEGELMIRIAGSPGASAEVRWLKVRVGDTVCIYASDVLARVQCCIDGLWWRADMSTPSHSLQWLMAHLLSTGSEATAKVAEFFGMTCRAILARDPSPLLGPVQKSVSASVLRRLLAMRISIGQIEPAVQQLAQSKNGSKDEDLAEQLISKLRPQIVEIQLPPDDLRSLSLADPNEGRDRFSKVRDELFETLGITFPDFEFVAAPELKSGSCRFRVNHVAGAPWPTIPSAGMLIEVESYGRVWNPATKSDDTLVALNTRDKLTSGPPRLWNAMEFVALCLEAELRDSAGCFIDTVTTSDYLGRIQQAAPILVSAVRAARSEEALTRALRRLVTDGVSIRDVYSILNRVLDFDYVVLNEEGRFVFDGRLPVPEPPTPEWIGGAEPLATFLRSGLKSYLTRTYSGNANTIYVYLLDSVLESALAQDGLHAHLSEEQIDDLVVAVREALRTKKPPPGAPSPVVLTTAVASAAMRNLIGAELPDLPILAFAEVSPTVGLEVLARIALPRVNVATASA